MKRDPLLYLQDMLESIKKMEGYTKKAGFNVSGRTGSHVSLSRITPEGKTGTVVPMHKELKRGTLKGILKLAKIDEEEFSKYL